MKVQQIQFVLLRCENFTCLQVAESRLMERHILRVSQMDFLALTGPAAMTSPSPP